MVRPGGTTRTLTNERGYSSLGGQQPGTAAWTETSTEATSIGVATPLIRDTLKAITTPLGQQAGCSRVLGIQKF